MAKRTGNCRAKGGERGKDRSQGKRTQGERGWGRGVHIIIIQSGVVSAPGMRMSDVRSLRANIREHMHKICRRFFLFPKHRTQSARKLGRGCHCHLHCGQNAYFTKVTAQEMNWRRTSNPCIRTSIKGSTTQPRPAMDIACWPNETSSQFSYYDTPMQAHTPKPTRKAGAPVDSLYSCTSLSLVPLTALSDAAGLASRLAHTHLLTFARNRNIPFRRTDKHKYHPPDTPDKHKYHPLDTQQRPLPSRPPLTCRTGSPRAQGVRAAGPRKSRAAARGAAARRAGAMTRRAQAAAGTVRPSLGCRWTACGSASRRWWKCRGHAA